MNPLSIVAMVLALATLAFFWWRKAAMTQALVIANFLVFVVTLFSEGRGGGSGGSILNDLAFRPSYLTNPLKWYTIVTAAFLHAGFAHVLSNMLVLLMAGLPFEERLGRTRYLIVYFFGAITAVLLHVVWVQYVPAKGVDVPIVGASGAVFAILGGFAATYPRDQIPMFLVFILLPRVPVLLAAVVLAGIEMVALFTPQQGIAHAAHIGGAIGGAIAGALVRPRRPAPTAFGSGRRLDYATLLRLAPDDRSRALVDRVRENSDTAELQRAWLDRLLVSLRCAQCGMGLAETKPGILSCEHGHEERYAT